VRLPPKIWHFFHSKRVRKAAVVGLTLFVAGIVAAYPVTNWWGDRAFAQAVHDLKARGYPMTMEDAFGPAPAREDSFFLHPAYHAGRSMGGPENYLASLEMTKLDPAGHRLDFGGRGSAEKANRDEAARVLGSLAPLEPRRKALLGALHESIPCLPPDWTDSTNRSGSTNLVDLMTAVELIRYLRDHAVLSLAAGNPDAACEDILAALKVSKGLRNPHLHNKQETRAELYGRQVVERTLLEFPAPGWNEAQLAALDNALSDVDLPAERAARIRAIPLEFRLRHDSIRSGKNRYRPQWSSLWQGNNWTLAGWEHRRRLLVDLVKPRGVEQIAAAGELRQLADMLDALDPAGPLAAVRAPCERLNDTLRPWSWTPVWSNLTLHLEFPAPEKAQATYDAAREVIAARRHQLRHGRFPASRESLDPEFSRNLPNGGPGRCAWDYRLGPTGDLEIEAVPPPAVGPVPRIRFSPP
jgi:hypothetical protein